MLVYIPKTEDKNNDGRGYVWAAWTFHEEEMYIGDSTKMNLNTNSQARGNLALGAMADPPLFPCYNQQDREVDNPPKCTTPKDNNDVDVYSVINHEIDIEIPTNAPQLDWEKQMTWNTMNVNTWQNDIGNYDEDTGAYYSQVTIKNPSGTFISDNGQYRWFTIDWFVNNNDFTQNYVAVYVDSPFVPPGQTVTMGGTALPTKPTKSPVYRTTRFVPTRAGRMNIGPWMAWWGYGGQSGGTPEFDTALCKMAYYSAHPYPNSGYDFPQNYDQMYQSEDGTVVPRQCDFQNITTRGENPNPKPNPNPNPPPGSAKTPVFVWVIVACAILAFVLLLVFFTKSIHTHRSHSNHLNHMNHLNHLYHLHHLFLMNH